MMGLFDSISLMEKLLDAKWLRNRILSNNIANADTPGYKRSDVSFEEVLKKNMEQENVLPLTTTHKNHISNIKMVSDIQPRIFVQNDTTLRNDRNNVDIDKEMVELTKNTLSYNMTADQLQRVFQLLNMAISEGRR
ncbi:MAG: flagellar basal-body rod protein FlgB [Thermoanaerobacteraceae bacterium]|uniref:Flagellar basal body rod protein FlgB n=2 Tax=Biomaibacter acetigenes TaxID=2316383 RepID=A0A3G2R517_9FIRM|nr:flagellar basal body rod protein FlgB [Biomaibacter acetigenes]MDK2877467.1 flagellar basal-body rod protein FlgB [Thermoanaerobacteraceae bacterium]MDN5301938.1 flagellar basal-body rod protein FlgB [Thermoanaerobacteraceae bacterium]MDN5312987.1 flagellar basal-body rod protein FlgB [Thermoanaerobacteraceae bacterium]